MKYQHHQILIMVAVMLLLSGCKTVDYFCSPSTKMQLNVYNATDQPIVFEPLPKRFPLTGRCKQRSFYGPFIIDPGKDYTFLYPRRVSSRFSYPVNIDMYKSYLCLTSLSLPEDLKGKYSLTSSSGASVTECNIVVAPEKTADKPYTIYYRPYRNGQQPSLMPPNDWKQLKQVQPVGYPLEENRPGYMGQYSDFVLY